MSHNHQEHHHHHVHLPQTLGKAFALGIGLNVLFVVVEVVAGLYSNSMGLLSDAGHNLSDVITLALSWFAIRLATLHSNKQYTYGYGKTTILVSLINSVLLFAAVGVIILESIRKFYNPQPVAADSIIIVAGVGVVINFVTALLFVKGSKKDLNVKGAFLHMAMDSLVSLGVVVSGLIIKYTGWNFIDPIVGLLISVIIIVSAWSLMRQSLRLTLDGVPTNIDIDRIKEMIMGVDGVTDIHHIHVWALTTSKNAITMHISIDNRDNSERIKENLRCLLSENEITHATIETEPQGYVCTETVCD